MKGKGCVKSVLVRGGGEERLDGREGGRQTGRGSDYSRVYV